ncbi:replication initiation and membrane attachment family protein [Vagococcus luciliae]|uniref:Replication initiation and membrane attachment protein n=1 Tax=Vagococcus luciliae TaxID=2920380 RepID=A0ABY5P0C8_9ENTE|nr:DnaD domain protein [Vagococcus luciliae]UUV99385.1 Replication initiation and membrane attachment protein [Vagococcus luciliae]
MNTQTHLKPKDTFEVHGYCLLNGEDTRVLNLLYQPIIGGNALMLYHNLLSNVSVFKKPTAHFVLQDIINNGLQELYQSRIKLEAIGLLKTYVRKKDEGYHYIYLLANVLPPHVFLADDVLSLLLLDRVGEQRFQLLVDMFQPDQPDLSDYSDITNKYTDTFQLSSERLVQSNKLIEQTNQIMKQVPTPVKPKLESETFDWEFFVDNLSGLNIDQTFLTNEFKPLVYTIHGLYGINELDMVSHVKYCLDYVTNKIDVKEFKRHIYKKYHQAKSTALNEKNNQVTPLTLKEEDQAIERHKNDLKHQGFSPEEIAVITSCERIAPLIFLKAIKEQKNGFVAQNERWTIENLKAQSNLPDEVINMLIHYSLVVLNNPSLNQNMVNTIANNWAQNKVFKASEALKQVKSFKQESTKKATSKNYSRNYSKKPTRKETLPDWATEDSRKETPLSGEELSMLEQQLKKFNQGGESS